MEPSGSRLPTAPSGHHAALRIVCRNGRPGRGALAFAARAADGDHARRLRRARRPTVDSPPWAAGEATDLRGAGDEADPRRVHPDRVGGGGSPRFAAAPLERRRADAAGANRPRGRGSPRLATDLRSLAVRARGAPPPGPPVLY